MDLVVSATELESGHLLIKSDVYEGEGDFMWVVQHPPSGWTARGNGDSPEDCQLKIKEAVLVALGDDIHVNEIKRIERRVDRGKVDWRSLSDEQLDDLIDAWHEGMGPDKSLHEFLGMTWDEYKAWAGPR